MDDFIVEDNGFGMPLMNGGRDMGGGASEFFPTEFSDSSPVGGRGGSMGGLDTYGGEPPSFQQSVHSEDDRHSSQFRDDGDEFGSIGGHGGTSFNGVTASSAPLDLPSESEILYEWRRKRAAELEEKADKERARKAEIIDEAGALRDSMNAQRERTMEAARDTNREKERVFLSGLEAAMYTNPGGNYWTTVAGMIDFDVKPEERAIRVVGKNGASDKAGDKKKSTAANAVLTSKPKPGKATDLGRMRQLLLKLKHNPAGGGKSAVVTEAKGVNGGGTRYAPQPTVITATGQSTSEWGDSVFF